MMVEDEKYTYPIVKETDELVVIRIDVLDFNNKSSRRFLNCYNAFDDFNEWVTNLGCKVIQTDSNIAYLCLSKNGKDGNIVKVVEEIAPELREIHGRDYVSRIYC